MALGPRVGGAYDLTGKQQFVIRGSSGYFYDRLQGDSVFAQSGNPPTGDQTILVNSTLTQVASGATGLQAPPASSVYNYDAKIAVIVKLERRRADGAAVVVLARRVVRRHPQLQLGGIRVDFDAGGTCPSTRTHRTSARRISRRTRTARRRQSRSRGQRAYNTDLLRPFRGLGAITTTWPRFHTQYDSIQTSYTRRFSHGWQAGLNWTLGLRYTGNTLTPQHFEHNADGTHHGRQHQAANDAPDQ